MCKAEPQRRSLNRLRSKRQRPQRRRHSRWPPLTPEAQIDQWVAPIALYPDSLLSQVLMASTYPDNVLQAVQWSQDNPAMKGDAAVQAVASQPWDPSVKSLVAFPALLAMMGENPPQVEKSWQCVFGPAA